jgi:hypothetical protein
MTTNEKIFSKLTKKTNVTQLDIIQMFSQLNVRLGNDKKLFKNE